MSTGHTLVLFGLPAAAALASPLSTNSVIHNAQPQTERELQALVTEACRWHRLLVYHPYDSRRSEPGYPDLTIVGKSVLFRELKSARGRVTDAQDTWLRRLAAASADAAVWRPADWPEPIVSELRNLS